MPVLSLFPRTRDHLCSPRLQRIPPVSPLYLKDMFYPGLLTSCPHSPGKGALVFSCPVLSWSQILSEPYPSPESPKFPIDSGVCFFWGSPHPSPHQPLQMPPALPRPVRTRVFITALLPVLA